MILFGQSKMVGRRNEHRCIVGPLRVGARPILSRDLVFAEYPRPDSYLLVVPG
jgi:hypothetical protein